MYKTYLVKSENVFFAATGVTDGDWLKGVHCYGEGIDYRWSCARRAARCAALTRCTTSRSWTRSA
ncbi:fructose-bisphosphatase class II, partial [Cloacibacillus porcorum]|uniref:fructose-bisphosphatase class II n=1 Tax=Cloacibacillus porcorum TaxID=1197717 RepID=UPI002A82A754